MNQYLSPETIAELLDVTPNTVRRWCREGDLPYSKFNRAVRIKRSDFEQYLKDNEI